MSQTPSCPKCGTQLPGDAPAGLCPKCLVQAALESGSQSQPELAATAASSKSSGFEPPAIEVLAQRFPQLEILELLGKGGMGAVYKARQRGLDRLVAVKILPPEVGVDAAFAERFMREARALAQLSHTNIVCVHDFGQAGGLYYFVMEYVDGLNLRQAILSGGMTPKEALAIVPQICDALQFAHDEGIVHRDIKPENILIDKRGRVKIADFGLAKLLGREQAEPRLTATHQVMGTLRYMAPEQLEGSHEVDHRADIYSLGVVFYELLTGELPIGRFAPPSKKVQIDVRLDEVVLRALEKEPELRWQHASDLRTSVDQITGAGSDKTERVPQGRKTDLPPTAPDARLSRCALAGAIWAPFALATLLLPIAFFSIRTVEIHSRAVEAHTRTGEPSAGIGVPAVAMMSLVGLAVLVGLPAPFGTTILGIVAISQIRRSAGKLYGLPLAVFDALVFPLLLLDSLILTVVAAATMTILAAIVMALGIPPSDLPVSDVLPALLILSISLPLVAWIDYRIVRVVWRNVTGYEPPPKPAIGAKVSPIAPQAAAFAAGALGTAEKPRLPLGFVAKVTLVAGLAWLLFPLLWNAREAGLATAVLAVGVVIVCIARRAQRFLPATAERWRRRGPLQLWMILLFSVAFAATGVYACFLAGYQTWDRMNWNFLIKSQDAFRQEYQGAEHRLLKRLGAFASDAPRAELTPDEVHRSTDLAFGLSSPPSPGAFASFASGAFLLFGVFIILGAYHSLLSDRYDHGTGWGAYSWPAVQLTIVTLLPALVYVFALFLVLPNANGTRFIVAASAFNTEQDIASVTARVDAWAAAHQFVSGDKNSWQLNRVPQGSTLARVAIWHLWRSNVFDRWQMTWAGLERRAPDIGLEIVGDAAGKQTSVTCYPLTRKGDGPQARAIQAQIDSLSAAIKDKTPLPGSKQLEMTTAGRGRTAD